MITGHAAASSRKWAGLNTQSVKASHNCTNAAINADRMRSNPFNKVAQLIDSYSGADWISAKAESSWVYMKTTNIIISLMQDDGLLSHENRINKVLPKIRMISACV